jgi:hypothetical protein
VKDLCSVDFKNSFLHILYCSTGASMFHLFRLLFLGELGTCSQNLMPTQDVEP